MAKHMVVARRRFLQKSALTGGTLIGGLPAILRAQQAPAVICSDASRPCSAHGLQIGDVKGDRAIIWSRADRDSRMIVEYAYDDSFGKNATVRLRGPHALETNDYTARLDLTGLPANADIFVRVRFQNLNAERAESEALLGRFRTAPGARSARHVKFLWSGDTGGQGWGIDLDHGGMKLYESMRSEQPDFFLHCGDTIYADGPMKPEVTDASGRVIWRNAYLDIEPSKLKVAEALDEFRGNYRYNLLDDNMRRFNAEVPQIWQWDDHETTNNWSDSKELDNRYTAVRNVQLLAARANRAFLDYAPMRWNGQDEAERIYRHIPYGPNLDVFVVDMRSYRAANGNNRETTASEATDFLGKQQIAWLKQKLMNSRATWKVIAADMPIGLVIGDGNDAAGVPRYEGLANGNGPALGRELEMVELLRFIRRRRIGNIVWLTADVHYCAAHYYDPDKAKFQDFLPFWEFVAGPAHAGTFGPNVLDNTFGPQVVFQKVPAEGQANLPPSAGLQFYGVVDIDPDNRDMQVTLKDAEGTVLFKQMLAADHRGITRR